MKDHSSHRIARVIRWINMFFIGLVSLCAIGSVAQAADCTDDNTRAKFALNTDSQFEQPVLRNYLVDCVKDFGTRYTSAGSMIEPKKKISENRTNFDVIITNLGEGLFTAHQGTDNSDEVILLEVKRFAEIVRDECWNDAEVSLAKDALKGPIRTPISDFAVDTNAKCTKIAKLAGMILEPTIPKGSDDPSLLLGECVEPDTRTAIKCARACVEKGESGDGCTYGTQAYEDGELWARAMTCARGWDSSPKPSECNACDLNKTDDGPACTGEVAEERTTPPGETPAPESAVTKASTPPDATSTDETNPINTGPDSTSPPDDLTGLANQLADNMFGNGKLNMKKPGGNLDVPAIKMDLNLDAKPVRAASLKDPRGITAPQARTFDPTSLFPQGSPAGRGEVANAKANQNKPGQAGPIPGFSGGRANLGSGGSGSGASPKKGRRRRGRRGGDLDRIADGLGGNSFLGADGRGSGGKGKDQEKVAVLDKKVRDQIKQNQARQIADKSSLNRALADGLGRAGNSRDLFLKASYFPDSTEVYLEMREKEDHLSPDGL